jgi:riboflavin kinase/FMN adenylyltransferase
MKPFGQERVFSSTAQMPKILRGGVVAIGNFDGVHLGHRAVLDSALAIARNNNIPAIVLTFEPHPVTWFRPQTPVFRLTPANQKIEILLDMGFDAVIAQQFDAAFASVTAGIFIRQILNTDLGAEHVVTGFNFHFGKDREGTPEFLEQAAKEVGFKVTQVQRITTEDGAKISSSRIRQFLEQGNVRSANALLGRNWQVAGTVVKGAQLGRTLGYPTANLKLPEEARLRLGIYAVWLIRADGSRHEAVASFGRRPTFDNGAPLLETFVFDFSDDLYGEENAIEFVDWIRSEEKFADVADLILQMDKDSLNAKKILSVDED